MRSSLQFSLSLMMFLEYFVWSAWYVTMGTYMGTHLSSTGVEIGAAYSALAIATMISPFFIGMVADRYFPAQRLLGFLHLSGAIVLYLSTLITSNSGFYWIILLYSLLYMPTIALTNSIAFNQMNDPGKQFPWIRVFGTIGWIAAGFLIGQLMIEKTQSTFYMAAAASVALGIFSFFLPDTPPRAKGMPRTAGSAMGTEAFVLFRDRSYLIFFISAILICIPLAFYYGFANPFLNEVRMNNAAGNMILGQVSEAVFILAIPFLFNRIGVKRMLLIGMSAWVLRYLAFAYGDAQSYLWLLYAGIILHGVCYDFLFVTGYMYTEKKAGEKIKNAAQGLFTFATYGAGMFVGTWVSGFVVDQYKLTEGHDWKMIWYVPAATALVVMLYFIFAFRERKQVLKTSDQSLNT